MLFLKNIKPFKFGTMTYRLNSSTPYNKGTVVFPLTENTNKFDSIVSDMIEGNKIALVSTDTVFTPRTLREHISDITVSGKIDKKSIISRISGKFKSLYNHPLTLSNQRGHNYIFNSSEVLRGIRNRFIIRNEKRFLAYIDYIFNTLAEVQDTYDDRYIIVNADDHTIPLSKGKIVVGDYKKMNYSVQNMLLYYIKFFPKEFLKSMAKSKATIVFYSRRGVFKYSYSDLTDMVLVSHAEGYSFEYRDTARLYGECVKPSHTASFSSLYSENATIAEDKIIDMTMIGLRKLKGNELDEDDDDITIEDHILDDAIDEDEDIDGYDSNVDKNTEEILYLVDEEKDGITSDDEDIVVGKDDSGDYTPVAVTPVKATLKEITTMRDKTSTQLINELSDNDVPPELIEALEELPEVTIGKNIDIQRVNGVYKRIKDAKLSRTKKYNAKEERYINQLNALMSSDEVRNVPKEIPKTTFANVEALDDLGVNSFVNFNKTYFETTYMSDVLGCFQHLSTDENNPLYLQSYSLDDTSDKLNNKKTLTVVLKDANGTRSTHRIDIPTLDGSIMYSNGNKMELQAQKIVKPVVKFGDRVMITANYNKAFCMIAGKYLTHGHSRILRFVNRVLDDPKLKSKVKYIQFGTVDNKDNIETTVEFSAIGNVIKSIYVDDNNCIFFDHASREAKYGKDGLFINHGNGEAYSPKDYPEDKLDMNSMVVGKENGKYIYINKATDRICYYREDGEFETSPVSDYVIRLIEKDDNEIVDVLHTITTKVRLGYSVMRIMSRNIPIIILLSYTEGLDTVLERAGIQYHMVIDDKKIRNTPDKYVLQFQDCSIVCDVTEVEHSLLLSGLQGVDLSQFTYGEFCDYSSGAAASLISELGNGNLPLYVASFKTAFIDHITKDVLSHYNLPTDFCGVILYANNLLATDKIMHDSDTRLYRIRSAEIIPAVLSKCIADSFAQYSIAKKRGAKTAKLETYPNMLITALQEQGNVATYSTVNPVVSADSKLKVTVKGPNGLNMDRAMSIAKRQESELSAGIISMPSVYSGSVGIVKRMSIDPNLISTRGYLKTPDSIDEIEAMSVKKFLSPSELVTPSTTSKDEGQRVFMNFQQKGHGTGTLNPMPANYTNGYDTMIGYAAEEFAHYAKKDGVITKMTSDFIMIDYTDGTSDVYRLKNIERHSAKAKYIDNEMNIMKGLKMGMKVKAQQPLAYNSRMFVEVDGIPVYCVGQLAFVAYQSGACVYEDSTTICESLQGSMASYDFKPKTIVLGKDDIIKGAITTIGSKIKSGDALMSYVHATQDEGLNNLLKNNESSIDATMIKDKTASNSGELVEINVFYSTDKTNMTNSIKNFIHKIELEYAGRGDKSVEENERVDKFKRAFLSRIPTKVSVGTKVAGRKIGENQIIVEYITKSYSRMGHADKITFFDALKGETSKILPDNMMPVGIESGIRVEAMMSPASPINRKVQSMINAGAVERMIFDAIEQCRKDLGLKSYLERKK